MISKVFGFKGLVLAASIGLLSGAALGAWTFYKLYTVGKVNMLERYIDRQTAAHESSLAIVREKHEAEREIASNLISELEVEINVKDNKQCNINARTEQLLDYARTGVSDAPRRTAGAGARPAEITQRQQILSCIRDGEDYRRLKVRYETLVKWIKLNRGEKNGSD